jgi:protein-disulfide isomerase
MIDPARAARPTPGPSSSTIARLAPAGATRRRAARPLALLAGLFAASVLVTGPAAAADPSPASSPEPSPAATAAATQRPSLTMAPLVTLRPIAPPPVDTPVDLADGYALGEAEAPVTVEIWEDFQCPYCQLFSLQVKPRIVDTYVRTGQARLVFRDLAFLGEESRWAAVAASLAADQDRFWPFHDYLFANLQGENVGSYSLDRMLEIAEIVGLDMDEFVAGLEVAAARQRFAELESRAREDAEALGIRATPTVVVNGTVLASPDWDTVRSAIDVALGAG